MRRCSDLSHKGVAAFGILLILGRIGRIKSTDAPYNVCETAKCKVVAEQLQASLKESVNPCDDIYNFVCGGWIEKNKIPEDEGGTGVISNMLITVDQRIQDLLKEEDLDRSFRPIVLARKIYRMCMAMDQRNIDGIAELDELVKAAGDWPILIPEDKENSKIPWQEIAKKLDLYFFGPTMYNIDVAPDVKNTANYALYIEQPSFLLPRSQLLEGDTVKAHQAYKMVLREVVTAFIQHRQTHVSQRIVDRDLDELFDFQMQLATISYSASQWRNVNDMYSKMSIENFQSLYDAETLKIPTAQINWLDVLQNQLSTTQLSIQLSDEIVVYGLSYFIKLAHILRSTPPRVIVNFLQWQFVHRAMFFTSKRMVDILFAAEKIIFGIVEQTSLAKICVASPNLMKAISYEYVTKFFPTETKADVINIFNEVKNITKEQVNDCSWMDSKTKLAAMEKLDAIIPQIGFPDSINRNGIILLYKDFNLGSTYLGTLKNVFIHRKTLKYGKLTSSTTRNRWDVLPTLVTAIYNPSLNVLTITAAILQDDMYDPRRPRSMNYGSLAFVMGHEMSHAFDDVGRMFDKNGNMHWWWTQQTIDSYKKRTQCFVEQYNDYMVSELLALNKIVYINGTLTLSENIGDSAAAHSAWKAWVAYKKRVGERAADERLPGLEKYSGDKLFFIGAVHSFCESIRPEVLEYRVKDDSHAPWHVRMIGALSNLPEFSDTFDCKVGDIMNPSQKCPFW